MPINNTNYLFRLLIWLLIVLFLAGCDLPHQPGPMPTTIVNSTFEPGLNIFGVLRLTDDTTSTSFIYIERALSPEEYDQYADSLPIVTDALVRIWPASKPDTVVQFIYHGKASEHKYVDSSFFPIGGETYYLTIDAPGLPQLRASTTVPYQPRIDTASLVIGSDQVSFRMHTSPSAYLYEVYLWGGQGRTSQRFPNDGSKSMFITVPFPQQLGPHVEIQVYAYDSNLVTLMNATSSILPHAFLPTISTVEGGYGGFGSLVLTRFRCY